MKRLLGVTIALILFTAGCGDSDDTSTAPPTQATTTTSSPAPSATTPSPDDTLTLAPGRVGAARAGMTKSEAAATGLFDTDVKVGGDLCPRIEPLQWKKQYADEVDVLTDHDTGSIVAMGLMKDSSLTTDRGIGLGSTLGEVTAAYGGDATAPEEAGYNQSGVLVHEGEDWLGFLFDETPDKVVDDSKVTFIEVTHGDKPGLMRDGC